MGIILMLGSVTLTYIIYKHNSSVLSTHSLLGCKTEGELILNNDVKYINDSGTYLTIVTKKSKGVQEVIRYSPCEQKVISKTQIKSQDD